MDYNTKNIGLRIKSRAKEKKIKLKEMLHECGLGINTISRVTNGSDIQAINLAKIADALDCSVDYLLGRTDNPESHK